MLSNFSLELVVLLIPVVVTLAGGYGYRTGAVSTVFLYQVFCEAFHGGKNALKYVYGSNLT